MKTMLVMILAAAAAMTGCTSSDHTISGAWRVGSGGGCQDSLFYSDTVDVTITSTTGAKVAAASLPCGDAGFALGIALDVTAAKVTLHAYAIGDGGERLETGTAEVELAGISGDRDIGVWHFTLAQ